jgi:hypothetical protein
MYCAADEDEAYVASAEPVHFREKVMNLVFRSLASLSKPIRELGIQNLQNINPQNPDVLASIARVLQNLHVLRLGIISERMDHAPEHELDVSFNPPCPSNPGKYIPSDWLIVQLLDAATTSVLYRAPAYLASARNFGAQTSQSVQ